MDYFQIVFNEHCQDLRDARYEIATLHQRLVLSQETVEGLRADLHQVEHMNMKQREEMENVSGELDRLIAIRSGIRERFGLL